MWFSARLVEFLLDSGLAPLFWRRRPGPVVWRGLPLIPGRVHTGEILRLPEVGEVLSALSADWSRVAIVDMDGCLPELDPDAFPGSFVVRPPGRIRVSEAMVATGLRGSFDAVIIVLELGSRSPPEALEVLRLARQLPARPWLLIACAQWGLVDPFWSTLRSEAAPRL